jgi:hypothetical protein
MFQCPTAIMPEQGSYTMFIYYVNQSIQFLYKEWYFDVGNIGTMKTWVRSLVETIRRF